VLSAGGGNDFKDCLTDATSGIHIAGRLADRRIRFVTDKPAPNDVDVFMIMDDNFDMGAQVGEAKLLFDHSTAQSHFGCSVFWIRRLAAIGGEQSAIEDWQIKRDGTMRGIVEISE
jgi:hypothetical protein